MLRVTGRPRSTFIDLINKKQECRVCREIKFFEEFFKKKGAVSGYDSLCKKCDNERKKLAYNTPRHISYETKKEYRKVNSIKNIEYAKEYRDANKDVLLEKRRLNVEHKKEIDRLYLQKFPEKIAAKSAKRRAYNLQATPSWADRKYIDLFYQIAKEESLELGSICHVDHIVPLKSKLVCGLHNEFNLQVLLGTENLRKSNVIWPDMPT